MRSGFVFFIIALAVFCELAMAMGGDMGLSTEPLTNGSATYPYLIEDIADFDEFSHPDNASLYWASDVCIKLMCDLDLSSKTYEMAVVASDTGINDSYIGTKFSGIFDGNDHIISNLTIDRLYEDYIGLFGYIDSVGLVKNLNIENVNIAGDQYVGGLAGVNVGKIVSCHVTGSVSSYNSSLDGTLGGLVGSTGTTSGIITSCSTSCTVSGGRQYIGGLAGMNMAGTIISCFSTGSVTNTNSSGWYVGGLLGVNYNGTIINCYATGAVTGDVMCIGGLVGLNQRGNVYDFPARIISCYATGSVNGASDVGGLVGSNGDMVTSCYATGSVSACDSYPHAGGLVGHNSGKIINCYATGSVSGEYEVGTGTITVGGLASDNSGVIANCYATGTITKKDIYGGLVARNLDGTLTSCFWDKQTSGTTVGVGSGSSLGVVGKNTSDMQTQSTFTSTGWDFSTPIWMITWQDYPRLIWNDSDIDNSGNVNLVDFSILARKWMELDCGFCDNADLTGDRNVELADLLILAANYLEITLQGHWKLDEITGTVAPDFSVNSRDATLINGPTWNSSGKYNGCLEFDGVDDYVAVSDYKGIIGTASRTCMAWIKTEAISRNIMSWGTELTGQKWMLRIESDGALGVGIWGGYTKTTAKVNDGQWHHVAAVLRDDGNPTVNEIRLYIDGDLQVTNPSNTQAISTAISQDIFIGAYENAGIPSSYFTGMIDDVRVYSKALSDLDIGRIFHMQ